MGCICVNSGYRPGIFLLWMDVLNDFLGLNEVLE